MSTNPPIWQREPRRSLPSLSGEVSADVCVIGLGGSGLACIRQLIASGRSVIGIDAVGIAAGAGGRNGGFLLGGLAHFHHDVAARIGRAAAKAIYEETLTEIDRIAAETPHAVRRTGTLRIARSPAELDDCAQHLAAMLADGLPAEPYDGPEGRGLFFPSDAAFDPVARCHALADDALANGALLFEQTPALEIHPGHVVAPHGTVHASHTVVAIDGGLETILPELSPRVRSARLQMLATTPLATIRYPRPVYARWGLDYWQQLGDGTLVLGGCRDVGGNAEWTTSTEVTDVVQSALTALLRDELQVVAPVTHRWAATVAYTKSGMPILEQVRPNVWAIGAYSGTGNVIGALCGRAVADLITERGSKIPAMLRA